MEKLLCTNHKLTFKHIVKLDVNLDISKIFHILNGVFHSVIWFKYIYIYIYISNHIYFIEDSTHKSMKHIYLPSESTHKFRHFELSQY